MKKRFFRGLLLSLLLCICAGSGIRTVSAAGGRPENAPAGTTTQVVLVTPHSDLGSVSSGRWRLLEATSSEVYEPSSGAEAGWWLPGYDDTAWSASTEVGWNPAWNTPGWAVIPSLGNYAAGYRSVAWNESSTWLHRNRFNIAIPAGSVISGASIQTFADDLQKVYINGYALPFNNSQPDGFNIPMSYLQGGINTLAMTDFSIGWTSGIQYVLTIQFTQVDPPTVRLLIDGVPGPVTRTAPGTYTLSWTSTHAAACSASSSMGDWGGGVPIEGSRGMTGKPAGTYGYTITCTNPGGSASSSVTAMVLDPLTGPITALYASLVLYAPRLGQPAQTLSGWVSGGTPPYALTIHVQSPSGNLADYARSGAVWVLTPADALDANFGTTEEGTWTAWADIRDSAGGHFVTDRVSWEVAWYPVHGTP